MHDLKCVTGNRKAEKVTTTLVPLLTNHVEMLEDDELLIWRPKKKKEKEEENDGQAGGRQSWVNRASTKAVAHEKAVKAGTKSKKVNKRR